MMVPIKSVGVAEKRGSDREMLTRDRKTAGSQQRLFLLLSLAFSRKKWLLLCSIINNKVVVIKRERCRASSHKGDSWRV